MISVAPISALRGRALNYICPKPGMPLPGFTRHSRHSRQRLLRLGDCALASLPAAIERHER
jgi:hypothetical protein